MPRPDQGDELVPKRPSESEFEKSYAPGASPHTGLKLGAVDYGADLLDSPLMRTLKAALVGWQPPAEPAAPGRALKDDDPRLVATARVPGREAWRKALEQLVVAAGAVEAKPTLFGFLGSAGAIVTRLLAERALPDAVVRVEPDWLLGLAPEHSMLLSLGEGRAADVVREEVAGIAAAAYVRALAEKRDVVCAPASVAQLQQAKQAGFRRIVVALASPAVAVHFDAVVNACDELVLLSGTAGKLEVLAQAKSGQLNVRHEKAFQHFKAAK